MGTAKGTSLPDAFPTLPAHPLFPKAFLAHLNTPVRRKSPRKHFFVKALRYRSYWRGGGGIAVSGGEPLLQADFYVNFSSLPKNSTFTPHWTPRDSHLPPPNLSFPA
ncbi:MAG: hypothetical protein ACLR8P_21025 [Clostridium fessum]